MNISQNLLQEIHTFFPAEETDIRSYSPLKLAYLGDAVFEIIIRTGEKSSPAHKRDCQRRLTGRPDFGYTGQSDGRRTESFPSGAQCEDLFRCQTC